MSSSALCVEYNVANQSGSIALNCHERCMGSSKSGTVQFRVWKLVASRTLRRHRSGIVTMRANL
jgi:hypothetical protein